MLPASSERRPPRRRWLPALLACLALLPSLDLVTDDLTEPLRPLVLGLVGDPALEAVDEPHATVGPGISGPASPVATRLGRPPVRRHAAPRHGSPIRARRSGVVAADRAADDPAR